MPTTALTSPAAGPVKLRATASDHAGAAVLVVALVLVAFLALPLLAILLQALQDKDGRFVWLANFVAYARTPALLDSLWNSLWVSAAGHGGGRARGLRLCLCADAQPHALQAAVPWHHADPAAGAPACCRPSR
jgi:ABC-type spermidine/putrescine transport system permease subunit I